MIRQVRITRSTVLTSLASLLVVGAASAGDRTAQQDQESLQGTWTLTAREVDGKVEKVDPDNKRHHTLIITRDMAVRKYRGVSKLDRFLDDHYFGNENFVDDTLITYLDPYAHFTYKIGPTTNPKQILFTRPRTFGRAASLGGTYVLEGDSLKMNFAGDKTHQPTGVVYQRLKRPVRVEKKWAGRLAKRGDEILVEEAPASGYVTAAEPWARLWKAWGRTEKQPEVDFGKELVLVHTLRGLQPFEMVPEIDDRGDLTMLCVLDELPPPEGDEASGPAPGFTYRMVVIRRDGIKSVGGKLFK